MNTNCCCTIFKIMITKLKGKSCTLNNNNTSTKTIYTYKL